MVLTGLSIISTAINFFSQANSLAFFIYAYGGILLGQLLILGIGYIAYRWGKADPSPNSHVNQAANFFIVIGILIMTLSGICSSVVLVGFISDLLRLGKNYLGNSFQGLLMISIFGGIPFLVGFLLFYFARKSSKKQQL